MAAATAPRTAPTEAEIREAIEDRAGRYGEIEHPKELLRQAAESEVGWQRGPGCLHALQIDVGAPLAALLERDTGR